jgi:putative nucleotidyltransferase with HDIG domain
MATTSPDNAPNLEPYLGRWVTIVAGQVVGSGRTPLAARRAERPHRTADQPFLAYVAGTDQPHLQPELPLSPVMVLVRRVLRRQACVPVYLVGGAVRDALLGRANVDLDFAVQGDAVELARTVADSLQGAFYLLDSERGTARALLQDHPLAGPGEPVILDFARLRGDDLKADLKDRDFTINAMALPAELESPTPAAIVDPFGGHADLTDGIVRAVTACSIQQDPVRGMRAVRHAAALESQIDSPTVSQIQRAAPLLPIISAERIRDELARLLLSPHPAASIRTLHRFGLLQHILPELAATQGVTQSPPHTLDVFNHTVRSLEQLDLLLISLVQPASQPPAPLAHARERLAPIIPHLARHLAQRTAGGRTRQIILYLAALLHDIGKPPARAVEVSGRIRFFRHEQVGAEMAAQRARSLALSVGEVRMIGTLIRHHMRPAWLAPNPSGRAIYRFFRDTREAGVETCLLSLGDGLGRADDLDPREWDERVAGVAALLGSYFDRYAPGVRPPQLITGRQLMAALHISPGPEVGRLLEMIREAQAAGEISSPAEALLLAQEAHAGPTKPAKDFP